MIPTLIIALREYLEVFLIIGVFLGISQKLHLKKEKEILFASLIGVLISLLLPITIFTLGNNAQVIFNEKSSQLLEGYLLIFSGFFIAYVVFSLHNFFVLNRSKSIIEAHQKLQKNIFDISIFSTIVFFILREGFEIALFTATTSLFSKFMENIMGLFLGFFISAFFGVLTFFAYTKFSINKIFKVTEYVIVLLGASFVANGINELMDAYMHKRLGDFLQIPLTFLPSTSTYVGHLIKNMTGLEQEFSFLKLAIMTAYITAIYLLFLKRKHKKASSQV